MNLSFVPLLQVQRDLYAMPRGMERFREYIRTMVDVETGDLALPLVAMNPMGQDHVPALIDAYLALGAEGVAADAVAGAARVVERDSPNPTCYRISLVVSDDLKGGWTNRYASEFAHRFESIALTKRGWLVGCCGAASRRRRCGSRSRPDDDLSSALSADACDPEDPG